MSTDWAHNLHLLSKEIRARRTQLRVDNTGLALVPTKKQGRLRGRLEVGHSLSGRGVSELLRQHRGVSVVKAADGCVFRHVFVVQEVG